MLADLILETTNAPGSSATITLLGAAAGRRSFNAGFGVGPSFYYVMTDGASFEWGIGSLASSTSLNRTTILGNSLGTTARIAFSGLTNIYNTLPAAQAIYRDSNGRVQMAGQRIEGLAASAGADHAPRQDQVLMLATGGTVVGTITATRHAADTTAYFELSGGVNPVWAFDANDYMLYGRSTDTLSFVTNGTNRLYLNNTDVVVNSVPLTLTVGGTTAAHATRKDYVDGQIATRLPLSGGTVTGNVTVSGAILATSSLQTYNSASPGQGSLYLNSGLSRGLISDGSTYFLPGQPTSVYALICSNDITSSAGRVSCVAPRGATTGWAMLDNTARFGAWGWNDASGGYVQIDVDGNARSIQSAVSDERLKQDIAPASRPALPDIRAIEFRDFRYRPMSGAPNDLDLPLQRGGFIAQQVRTIKEEWVQELADEQKTLVPNTLLMLSNALQAIQEIDAEVQALKAEVAALKGAPAARKRRAAKS